MFGKPNFIVGKLRARKNNRFANAAIITETLT